METNEGVIIISVILGFGLATLFRKACKNKGCFVIKGPKLSEVQPYTFKVDEKCYKYTPEVVKCTSSAVAEHGV